MSVASQPVLDPPVHGKGGLALKRDERRAAAVGCGAHALHDGYTDLIYVMLPIWQREFGLGFAELGLLRALFSGTMAGLQIPSGLIAERLGTAAVLALGTALAGAGYCLAGASAALIVLPRVNASRAAAPASSETTPRPRDSEARADTASGAA